MNENENEIFIKLRELVEIYENAEGTKADNIYEEINKVAARSIDREFLDCYWNSMDLDEFCEHHSIIEFDENLESLEIEQLLIRLIEAKNDHKKLEYLINKYSNHIELHFKKNTGTILEHFFCNKNEVTLNTLLLELKSSDVIEL